MKQCLKRDLYPINCFEAGGRRLGFKAEFNPIKRVYKALRVGETIFWCLKLVV